MDTSHFFLVSFNVSFIYPQTMKDSFTFPASVIIKTADNTVFTNENIDLAKIRAIEQVCKFLQDAGMEQYAKEAQFTLPVLMSVSYLGSGSKDDFLGTKE